MKNENAFTGILLPLACIIVIIICTGTFWILSNPDQLKPKYTNEITISGTDYGSDGFTIISTDNVIYRTQYQQIYFYATSHSGQRVKLVYVAGNNNECYVTEIHLITNRTVCTIDKCGTSVTEVKP